MSAECPRNLFDGRSSGASPKLSTKPKATIALVALIHSQRQGRRWNVEFGGEVVVRDSRDPEFDLARALHARGLIGSVTILDGQTRKPRIIIRDIAKAAELCTEEGPYGPRFVRRRKARAAQPLEPQKSATRIEPKYTDQPELPLLNDAPQVIREGQCTQGPNGPHSVERCQTRVDRAPAVETPQSHTDDPQHGAEPPLLAFINEALKEQQTLTEEMSAAE